MYLDVSDKSFCEAAIALNLLSIDQIQNALDKQKVDRAIGVTKPIGAYLFESNILTKEQIAQIVSHQESHPSAESQSLTVQSDKETTDIPKRKTSNSPRANAQGCGCAALLIAIFVCYLGGWQIVLGQSSLTVDSMVFEIGSRDFILAGNAVVFKVNSLFYGLYLIPRFYDSYFLSWMMLLIGFKIVALSAEAEKKSSKDK